MKNILTTLLLAALLAAVTSSCAIYEASSNGFSPAGKIPATSRKAYIQSFAIPYATSKQLPYLANDQIQPLIAEVTRRRPDVFCTSPEEGVPMNFDIISNKKVSNTWTVFFSVFTLGFIPYASAEGWHFTIRAKTVEDAPLKIQHTEISTLELQQSCAPFWSIFWPFYYFAPGKVSFTEFHTLEGTNWFMTQEFADNVAFAAASLLKRLEEAENSAPDSPLYIPPSPTTQKIKIRRLPQE